MRKHVADGFLFESKLGEFDLSIRSRVAALHALAEILAPAKTRCFLMSILTAPGRYIRVNIVQAKRTITSRHKEISERLKYSANTPEGAQVQEALLA